MSVILDRHAACFEAVGKEASRATLAEAERDRAIEAVKLLRTLLLDLYEDGQVELHMGRLAEPHENTKTNWVECPEDDTCDCDYAARFNEAISKTEWVK